MLSNKSSQAKTNVMSSPIKQKLHVIESNATSSQQRQTPTSLHRFLLCISMAVCLFWWRTGHMELHLSFNQTQTNSLKHAANYECERLLVLA